MSKKKNPETLHVGLAATLRQRIVRWYYTPGSYLLETDLCAEFNVSRSPVREALKMLSATGFLENAGRRGYKVVQPDTEGTLQIYEARLAIELFTIQRVTRGHGDPQIIEQLRKQWNNVTELQTKTTEQLAEADRTFHERLTGLLKNAVLSELLEKIDERIEIFREIEFSNPDILEQTSLQHLRILDAVESGDAVGAVKAIEDNISTAMQNVEHNMKEILARAFAPKGKGSA
jgi:DNA-binding GntR family transcriptional regulator